MQNRSDEITLPLASEEATIHRADVVRGRTRINVKTVAVEETVATSLAREAVEVKHVAIGRLLEEGEPPPEPRIEDGVLVFPVLEEVPVVTKRLRIVEELHVAVRQRSEQAEIPVTLRKQRLDVERIDGGGGYPADLQSKASPGDSDMTVRTLTAVFQNRNEATRAVERLAAAGIPRTSVRILPETDHKSGTGSYDTARDEKGFWESLGDFFFPDEDRYSYAEAMHRGDVVVTASVEDAMFSTAEDILDDEGTVSMDDREESWRKEGWSGWQGERELPTSSELSSAQGFAEAPAREGVIPLAEEELNVGKREVGRGRVRVRSYVVEKPVTADVNLREEQVRVERRPVDRTIEGGNADDLFRERSLEIEERGEEAVVNKKARVREEVAVGKTVEERTEHISDTVRRSEVEVEDERGQKKRRRDDA